MMTGFAELIATVITALIAVVTLLRVQQVHVMVNANLSRVLARVDQLEASLDAAGVGIPPKPGEAPPGWQEKHL